VTQASEVEVRVQAAPHVVFAHLRDPRSYVGLSPLVVEVRDIREGPDAVHYVAVERFRFAGLRYDNLIRVELRADDADAARLWVGGDVDSPGNVQLRYGYTIAPDGDGSRVVDRIEVTAPFGLRRFAFARASEVQRERGRILAERLGAAPAAG